MSTLRDWIAKPLLALVPLALGAPVLTGCMSPTHEIVINEVPWDEALSICSRGGRAIRGCAIKDGPMCIVVVPEGDPKIMEHELAHCRDGAFHS